MTKQQILDYNKQQREQSELAHKLKSKCFKLHNVMPKLCYKSTT